MRAASERTCSCTGALRDAKPDWRIMSASADGFPWDTVPHGASQPEKPMTLSVAHGEDADESVQNATASVLLR